MEAKTELVECGMVEDAGESLPIRGAEYQKQKIDEIYRHISYVAG